MRPTTHSQEKMQNPKCRLVHFKNNRPNLTAPKETLPPKNQVDLRKDISNRCNANEKPPENYENLLLFYLTKLKKLFSNNHPEPTARENSALKMNRLHHDYGPSRTQRASSLAHPYKYTSSNPPRPRDEEVNSKVYKVVSAALEYGFANNVLEKKGDCFFLKNKHPKMVNRQSTPGPRYCERCYNVQRYARTENEFPSKFSERHKPMPSYCEKPLHHIEHGKIGRTYRDHHNGMNSRFSDSYENMRFRESENSNTERVKTTFLHCPKCRSVDFNVRK